MRLPFTRRDDAEFSDTGEEPQPKKESLLRFLITLAILAWAIRSFLVAPFSIPSGSMLPKLFVGDYVMVAKWPYGYSRYSFPFGFPSFDGRILGSLPARGDVVVFRPPGAEFDFIKRVIGLPGDTVGVRGGTVILNGRPLSRELRGLFPVPVTPNSRCKVVPPATPMIRQTEDGQACMYPAMRETLPGGKSYLVLDQVDIPRADEFQPVRVPEGHIFLMGDNRDDSLDSRFDPAEGGIGMVPVENVVGRAMIIFWSTDGSASYIKPWTWFTALRGERMGTNFSGNVE